ncbi:MAG: 50S ribosomal protein L35 [Parcubacteria group bacterium]|nr:50S ribosomal protein L35 [Parcubacteria group bacterium]
MSKGFRPKKALLKRIKITGKGKMLRRQTRLNHFNAKDTGQGTRRKRKDSIITKSDQKAMKQLLPF